MAFEFEYYESGSGRCPAHEFIDSLEKPEKIIVDKRIAFYCENELADETHIKPVREDIWEFRINLKTRKIRILCYRNGKTFIALHALFKKYDRLKENDIKVAYTRRNDYLSEREKK